MATVTVWNEYRHEKEDGEIAVVYPDGIHATIAEGLREVGCDVQMATLDDPKHGLTESVLDDTDVLAWWDHRAHDEVEDAIVDCVVGRVRGGMGLLVFHPERHFKPFERLMGTTCSLKRCESGEKERVWVVEPDHPIADGLPESFKVLRAEMYGEWFDIPAPDELVFTSWLEDGEVSRSGCCYTCGKGRVFYFRSGHEIYPIYEQAEIRTVLDSTVEWAAPGDGPDLYLDNVDPIEDLD